MGSLSCLLGNFLTQELNKGLLHCSWIIYQLRYQSIPGATEKFFQEGRSNESSKEPEPVPSTSGMSEISASISYRYWSFISALSHLLSLLHSIILSVHSMPTPICQLLYSTTVLFKALYSKIKKVFFMFCTYFLCVICVKSSVNLLRWWLWFSHSVMFNSLWPNGL